MGQAGGVAQVVGRALMAPPRDGLPEFHADQPSPAGDGASVVLSEPIPDMTPEEFWELFAKEVRTERRAEGVDRKFFERPDGGVLVVPMVPTGSGRKVALHVVWYLKVKEGQAVGVNFDTDETLSHARSRVTLRTYPDPFRIECRTTVQEQREAGEAQRQVMESVLASMGSSARCYADAAPPGAAPGAGGHSVLSDPITDDSAAPPDTFWRQSKEFISAQAQRVEPDGTMVHSVKPRWRFWDASLYWTRHVFDDEALEVRSYNYGKDEAMALESLRRVSHLRIHRDPYRLEMFTVVPEHTAAGEPERAFLADLMAPVFGQARGHEEADFQMLEGLSEELKTSYKEVRGLVATLHTDMAALKEVPPVPAATA